MVDKNGRHGESFGGETFYFQPSVQVFHDTNGRPYAFIKGHHRGENNFIVAMRGRTLLKKCECYGRYGADCQPLPHGGALITQFDRTRDVEGVPAAHQNDSVVEVSRFRQGKLTNLGLIYLPVQEYP